MNTYYPSPVGVYSNVTVTSGTVLARDGGNVGVGTASPASKLDVAGNVNASGDATVGGNVGIGTAVPAAKLDVNGNMNVSGNSNLAGNANINGVLVPGRFASDPTDTAQITEGAIYFNTTTKKHRVSQSSAWQDLGGGGTVTFSDGEWLPAAGQNCCRGGTHTTFCPAGKVATGIRISGDSGGGGEVENVQIYCQSLKIQ